jgi:diguanylate cyclase (GGDEF)-like protein/PAS domain S-box-containing protein
VKGMSNSTDKQKRSRASEGIQQELSELSDLAQALLRCAGTGVYIVQDGKFQYANSLFQELTGYSELELLGKYTLGLVYPEDRETVREKAIESLKGGSSLPYEYRFVRKDGEIIWVLEKVTSTEYKGKRATVGSFMDITERKQLEQKLAVMATHDPLTGLPNRLLLSDRLAVGLAQAQRNNTSLAVMMLDLDRFKTVNDTFGHIVGDELLRAAGERLIDLVRKSDTVARMGGDEFVVLLLQIAKTEDAVRVAQKILEVFRKAFVLGDYQIRITTSIGIAIYPEDGEDIETLFRNADTAMYWAKEQGRDNYELYWHNGTRTL